MKLIVITAGVFTIAIFISMIAHSAEPSMLQRLEELDEEIEKVRSLLY